MRDAIAAEVMELKAQPGGDLALNGADLAAAFMRQDLIDEYRLYVHPIAGSDRAVRRRTFDASAG